MKYLSGKIYRIICLPEPELQYIGSTFDNLRNRIHYFKHSKRSPLKHYFEKFGKDNFKIILIKEYPVVDKLHLNSKLQLWINRLSCINKKEKKKFIFNPLIKNLPKDKKVYKRDKFKDNFTRRANYRKKKRNKLHLMVYCQCSLKPFHTTYKAKHEKTKKHLNFMDFF